MPAPDAPGIISLEAIFNQEDEVCENTFHYHHGATIDIGVLTGICNTYAGWFSANAGLFHNATALIKIQARDLSSSSGASFETNVNPPVSGTSGPGALPNNVTIALKRQTGLRGRKNRGRIYLIGLGSGHLQTGSQKVDPTYVGDVIAALDGLLTAELSDNAATEVIYHKALGTGTPVINYAYTDLDVDSQRRRLPGHNRHH